MKKLKKNTIKKSAVKLRKDNNKIKLFDCKRIGISDDLCSVFTLRVSPDVVGILYNKLGYDANNEKQFESYLRKSFRKFFGFRKP